MFLECFSKREIRKFEQILCQFKEETRRLSSAKSRVDDAEMAQRYPKLRIKEFLRHTLERERCSYRTLRTDCSFLAHFNLWWARQGWRLIHLVSRRDGQFSRPPYFPAAVNLTADIPSEPPRGGERGAGANQLNRKTPFAESRTA